MDMGRGEERVRWKKYGKSTLETYITICKTDSQQEFAVWLKKLKQGLCINLEEGMGRDMGGDICIPMADYFLRNKKEKKMQGWHDRIGHFV